MTKFAFYVSGHGYGHATRASALTISLLSSPSGPHSLTVVTNAPALPFSSILPPSAPSSPALSAPTPKVYASYRYAPVDAGIVQPKAYEVDRAATVAGLEKFMDAREGTLEKEVEWLKSEGIECVLSDATFLGLEAAKRARIPGILVSNFTFDPCYSYLSHPSPPSTLSLLPPPEAPYPAEDLDPLVNQCIADYSGASLLLRLPGAIPIPAFDTDTPLPAGKWVNSTYTAFTDEIEAILSRATSEIPSVKEGLREVIDVPMIVRPPAKDVYTKEFRDNLLDTMGVPVGDVQERAKKILLVSFGGQAIPRPRSAPPSPTLGSTKHTRKPGLLPKGWIAIVCGLGGGNAIKADLPKGFYASDSDVYVPDLTAVADVVLGKLGYGTCSETLSCQTPFVYVPRPLFVEEFGLKRLMQSRGTAVEITRADFEAGVWSPMIEKAWELGKERKEKARLGWEDNGAAGIIVGEIEAFLERKKIKTD